MDPFLCDNAQRRSLLLAQATPPGTRLDGVDLLLVLDDHDGPSTIRQRVLLVRLLFGDEVANLTADHVEITGGVRSVDPHVPWAGPMAGLVPAAITPALTADEATWLSAVLATADPADAARTLVVLVDAPGDFSTYTLGLVDAGGTIGGRAFDTAFDRRSVAVDFSFKVECPTPFDCRIDPHCAPEPEVSPEIDYLARDFQSFRRLMLDRIALLQPDTVASHPATLSGALVDLLAYAADRAAYHQDAVATEAYLGTARLRRSVRRHARLLDYPMHEGCNARSFVHVALADAIRIDAGGLRTGAVLLTQIPDLAPVVAAHEIDPLPRGVIGFAVAMDAPVLSAVHNTIALHTWGDSDCCLRAGATGTTLVDEGLELAVGDLLLLEQIRSPQTDEVADADPDQRWVVRLTAVSDPIDDLLLGVTVRQIEWHADDAPQQDVPVAGDPHTYLVARGNLVLVDQGLPLTQALALQTSGRNRRVTARLGLPGLTFAEAIDVEASASALVRQDPTRAMPVVSAIAEGESWFPVTDLLSSPPTTPAFVVEMDNDRTAWLRFGDDIGGRRPTDDTIFESQQPVVGVDPVVVTMARIGNGPSGNVGAEAIRHVLVDPIAVDGAVTAAITAIRNPVPAVGGTAPETLDQVKLYAPQAFRVQERAVTAADWAEVAARHPQVARATAQLRWTGSWTTVFVYVDRVGGGPVDATLLAELVPFLDRYRMAGMDLEVRPPQYVPLDIALSVCVEDGYFPEEVEAALARIFGSGRLPDGSPGFFHPDGMTFGQSVYLSALLARAMAVPGVRWLDATPPSTDDDPDHRFKRLWAPDDGTLAAGRIGVGTLEIPRCDSDPNLPENGQIRFHVRSRP